jgi:uncharacterized membrane protein required for colicin V production
MLSSCHFVRSFVRPSVLPLVWYNLISAGRIFVEFYITVFYYNASQKIQVWLQSDTNSRLTHICGYLAYCVISVAVDSTR